MKKVLLLRQFWSNIKYLLRPLGNGLLSINGNVKKVQKKTETKRKVSSVCIGKLQNTNAVKHGLFSKYLPAKTLELVGSIEAMSPLDILWENICLKYAAIIRSQKIMFVKNANDYTKRITLEGESLAFQYTEAYEKQASFLIAQSRAMGTLMSLIKQYDELCRSSLATDEQRLRIEKLKTEIAKTRESDNPAKVEIVDNVPNMEVETSANKFKCIDNIYCIKA